MASDGGLITKVKVSLRQRQVKYGVARDGGRDFRMVRRVFDHAREEALRAGLRDNRLRHRLGEGLDQRDRGVGAVRIVQELALGSWLNSIQGGRSFANARGVAVELVKIERASTLLASDVDAIALWERRDTSWLDSNSLLRGLFEWRSGSSEGSSDRISLRQRWGQAHKRKCRCRRLPGQSLWQRSTCNQ